jgi:glycosyltransferase involved in cell wall biosynthesis
MKKIRVKLVFEDQSAGRGVGFYGEALRDNLAKLSEVELVDKNADVVHYTYFKLFVPDLPLVFGRQKIVATIHDLTPLVLPELYPVGLKGKAGLIYQQSRAKKINAIVTDSQNSKDDISRLFAIDKHKLFVTPLASRSIFFDDINESATKKVAKKYQLPKDFVLTVAGGPNPNKNLYRLAEACKDIGMMLVIVGKGVGVDPTTVSPHPELRDFFKIVKMDNVRRIGFVSEEDLLCLYKMASLYCQASIYEGFGLPLLEAMAAKSLIVSSNTSSLPEIYSNNTPSFDPLDVAQMSSVIKTTLDLSDTKKNEIIKRNYQRAREFSFDRMAMETLAAYKYTLMI